MKKNKIKEIDGWGTLTRPTSMDVALNDGSTRQLTFDNLIIAAGAVTRMLPGVTVSPERRHLRGADPRREPAGLDHHRRLRRDRRRVRLRDEELRRRRHDRRVPRPDGAHRGRRHLQGARQALQEARREGAAQHQGRGRRGHRLRRAGHRLAGRRRRPAGARGRQGPLGHRLRAAHRGLRPRGGRRRAHRPRRHRDRRVLPHQRRRTSTPSATAPPS